MTYDQVSMRKLFLKLQIAILSTESYDGLKGKIEALLDEFPDEISFKKAENG